MLDIHQNSSIITELVIKSSGLNKRMFQEIRTLNRSEQPWSIAIYFRPFAEAGDQMERRKSEILGIVLLLLLMFASENGAASTNSTNSTPTSLSPDDPNVCNVTARYEIISKKLYKSKLWLHFSRKEQISNFKWTFVLLKYLVHISRNNSMILLYKPLRGGVIFKILQITQMQYWEEGMLFDKYTPILFFPDQNSATMQSKFVN